MSLSFATARRLVAAGKLAVVQLSERRIGITAAESERFLKSCERTSTSS
jgi:hypothetical protein